VRFSAVESSTGMGLPSAVEGSRLVEESLGWKGRRKVKGMDGARVSDAEMLMEE
jgi:hypothetical protein